MTAHELARVLLALPDLEVGLQCSEFLSYHPVDEAIEVRIAYPNNPWPDDDQLGERFVALNLK